MGDTLTHATCPLKTSLSEINEEIAAVRKKRKQ
jgi:hypothetical protein